MNKKFKVIAQGNPDALKKRWHYDATADAPKGRVEGQDVTICDYRFTDKGKSVISGWLVRGKEHGRTVAKSDHYYAIVNGAAKFVFYDTEDSTTGEEVVVSADGAIMIEAGTCYNYFATESWDMDFVLFRDIVK